MGFSYKLNLDLHKPFSLMYLSTVGKKTKKKHYISLVIKSIMSRFIEVELVES